MSPEQVWDLLWFIAGGASAFVVAVPIAAHPGEDMSRRACRHFLSAFSVGIFGDSSASHSGIE
jgi:hypothetical protein